MKKEWLGEILVSICAFYTVLSILNAILLEMNGYSVVSTSNSFLMLMWCTVGTCVIYSQKILTKYSPVAVMICQYFVAIGIILLSIYVSGLFDELHPDAYKDGFRSFTIPYIVGSALYYGHLYFESKKQNTLLQEVKELNK